MRSVDFINNHGPAVVYGSVLEVNKDVDNVTSVFVHVDSLFIDDLKYLNTNGLIKVWSDSLGWKSGTSISGDIRIVDFSKRRFSSFDYENWMNGNYYSFVAYADSLNSFDGHSDLLHGFVSSVRSSVYSRLLNAGISKDNAGFLVALFVGDKSHLSNSLKEAFIDCGIVHILAVSGLHVGIIYQIFALLFAPLRRKRPFFGSFVIVILLFSYALICGFSPSVFRVTIMMAIIEFGFCFRRSPDVLNSLWLSVFVILLVNPFDVYSVGLYLSFTAVWGIVSFYPFICRNINVKNKFISFVLNASAVSVVAQFATLPVSLLFFHRFPVYFLIHNILLVWLVGAIIVFTIIVLSIGGSAGFVLDQFVSLFCDYVEWGATWPCSVIENIPFNCFDCLSLMLLIYLLSWYVGHRFYFWQITKMHLALMLSCSLFVCSCLSYCFYRHHLSSVVVVDYYGNMMLSVNSNGKSLCLLADTTDIKSKDMACKIAGYYYCSEPQFRALYKGQIIKTKCGHFLLGCLDESFDYSYYNLIISDNDQPVLTDCNRVFISQNLNYYYNWIDLYRNYVDVYNEPYVIEKFTFW